MHKKGAQRRFICMSGTSCYLSNSVPLYTDNQRIQNAYSERAQSQRNRHLSALKTL